MDIFTLVGGIIGIVSGIMAIVGIEGVSKWKIIKSISKRLANSATSPFYLFNGRVFSIFSIALLLNTCVALATYKFMGNGFGYVIVNYIILVILCIYLLKITETFQQSPLKFKKRFKFIFVISLIYHIIGALTAFYIFYVLDPEFYKKKIIAGFISAGVPAKEFQNPNIDVLKLMPPWFYFFSAFLSSFFLSLLIAMLLAFFFKKKTTYLTQTSNIQKSSPLRMDVETGHNELVIKIKSTIQIKEYIYLSFFLTYRKPIMLLSIFIGLTMLIITVLYFLGVKTNYDELPKVHIVTSIISLFILPYIVYWRAKRHFSSNVRLRETTEYEFLENKILVYGQTYKMEIGWNEFYRLEELNSWVLIYQDKMFAIIIPKRFFDSQLTAFRALVAGKIFQAHKSN